MHKSFSHFLAKMGICLSLLFLSCSEDPPMPTTEPSLEVNEIITQLQNNYELLPEGLISVSRDSTVFAQYASPTSAYTHGVMGDIIEGGKLVVYSGGQFYELDLASDYVFEDLRPRLVDVDQDGELEFVCIRTQVDNGAGLVIYKIENETLEEYAFVEEIGRSNRWLNYVAADDLDNDGVVELAWIQTPHIGGILKVARMERGELTVLAESSLYSNHGFGERNLCLSVLIEKNNKKLFYVPTQDRDKIIGFSFRDEKFLLEEEIAMPVDFSMSLKEQYAFENIIAREDNCIKG